jgi:hypothetical protein
MKFVFYKSGDVLELEPNPAKVIERWFDYMFDNNINDKYTCNNSTAKIVSEKIKELNNTISQANYFISERTNGEASMFEFSPRILDQKFLNATHKKWVYLTDTYKNEIHPQPKFWHDVNRHVHDIESRFSADFKNQNDKKLWALPQEYKAEILPEDGDYWQNDLMLSFRDLGRHQHNQWMLGSHADYETSNYKNITLDFSYKHYIEQGGPDCTYQPSIPKGYIEWCKQQNLPILAPWLSIGKFKKYDRYEVRKIFHKNLIKDSTLGFEL